MNYFISKPYGHRNGMVFFEWPFSLIVCQSICLSIPRHSPVKVIVVILRLTPEVQEYQGQEKRYDEESETTTLQLQNRAIMSSDNTHTPPQLLNSVKTQEEDQIEAPHEANADFEIQIVAFEPYRTARLSVQQ